MRLATVTARDEELLKGVADLINRDNEASGLADYSEAWDADMVRLWVERRDERLRLLAAVTEAGSVVGFALINGWGCSVAPVVDPASPAWLAEGLARGLLATASSALCGMGCGGLVRVSCGVRGGYRHSLLRAVAEPVGEEVSGALMVFEGLIKLGLPAGYVVRYVVPHEDPEALGDIVRVRNEAFAEYGWEPVDADDLRPYYADLARRYGDVLVAVAYAPNGEPAGYVEAFVHEALSGRLAGEVSMVAVRPTHRGRGLGSYLIALAVQWLSERAGTVYLHAVREAQGLYQRLGFKVHVVMVRLLMRPVLRPASIGLG